MGEHVSRRPHGSPEQPPANRRARPHPGRFSRQGQERGLEGVVSIVTITGDAAADGENGRAVPANQLGERGLVTVSNVLSKEFRVGDCPGEGGEVQ